MKTILSMYRCKINYFTILSMFCCHATRQNVHWFRCVSGNVISGWCHQCLYDVLCLLVMSPVVDWPQGCFPAFPRCAGVSAPSLRCWRWRRPGGRGIWSSSSILPHSRRSSWHPTWGWSLGRCSSPPLSTHCGRRRTSWEPVTATDQHQHGSSSGSDSAQNHGSSQWTCPCSHKSLHTTQATTVPVQVEAVGPRYNPRTPEPSPPPGPGPYWMFYWHLYLFIFWFLIVFFSFFQL